MFKFLNKLFCKKARVPFRIKGHVDKYIGTIKYVGPMGTFFNGDTMDLYRLSDSTLLATTHLPFDKHTQITSVREWIAYERKMSSKRGYRRPLVEIKTDFSKGEGFHIVADEFEGITKIRLHWREYVIECHRHGAIELRDLLTKTVEELDAKVEQRKEGMENERP